MLKKNYLSALDSSTYEEFSKFQFWYLYDNEIHHIDEDTFKGHAELQVLLYFIILYENYI